MLSTGDSRTPYHMRSKQIKLYMHFCYGMTRIRTKRRETVVPRPPREQTARCDPESCDPSEAAIRCTGNPEDR